MARTMALNLLWLSCVMVHVGAVRKMEQAEQVEIKSGGKQQMGSSSQVPEEVWRSYATIDMYRGMTGLYKDRPFVNTNLADIQGVLKYIHTEVIPEHVLSINRWQRKYAIDTIVRRRFKIMNQDALLAKQNFLNNMDLGPFCTMDAGQSTNNHCDVVIQSVGDYVGVQQNGDLGYKMSKEHPYFWFSTTGYCPNFAWYKQEYGVVVKTARCVGPEHLCDAKGPRDAPNNKCLRHGDGKFVMGGLCDDKWDHENFTPKANPTGGRGCVYTYGTAETVLIDELVGITKQKCGPSGDRLCTDWYDFRKNCFDQKTYRKAFKAGGSAKRRGHGPFFRPFNSSPVHEKLCIEYDIHPACKQDCLSAACMALPPKDRETGLKFWLGRCSPMRNRWRAEKLAKAFGIEGAMKSHWTTDKKLFELDTPCRTDAFNYACNPSQDDVNGGHGGPFCSRKFSGVCQNCYIPNTQVPYPAKETEPMCPYDILDHFDYRKDEYNERWPLGSDVQEMEPNCKTKNARDLCCLYTGTCSGSGNPASANLDEDGFAFVAHRQNSDDMETFLGRYIAKEWGTVPKGFPIKKVAYWAWGLGPTGKMLKDIKTEIQSKINKLR